MKKILHVWDQAGVSCVLAKYQRRLGHDVKVIKRAGFDKFKIYSFYGETEFKTLLGFQFLKIAEKESKNFDIIHVHDLFNLVPRLKKKYSNKKIILHYHGSILRNTPVGKREKFESFADEVLVSTPDLQEITDCKYIQNPVDTEHFSPRSINENKKALSLLGQTETPELISNLLKKHNITLNYETISRERKPIFYNDMPNFLSNYEYLIDLKYIDGKNIGKFVSMTGLQALSLGQKILNYDFKIIQGLPNEHKPENVVKKLMDVYN